MKKTTPFWRNVFELAGSREVVNLRNRVHVLEAAVADCLDRIDSEDPDTVRGLEALKMLEDVRARLEAAQCANGGVDV